MTEYESERERLAMVTDLQLLLAQAEEEGKPQVTAEEIRKALLEFAKSVKPHK